MTALASELDRKLTELNSERARLLKRLVRDAMALASAQTIPIPAPDGGVTELEVQPLKLSERDCDELCRWLDEPPRDLPRLRWLLQEPSIFKDA